jgi:two-component system, OmpR family, sensor histidine kinase BaeS
MPIKVMLVALDLDVRGVVSEALERARLDAAKADAELAVVPLSMLRGLSAASGRAGELERALQDQRDELEVLSRKLGGFIDHLLDVARAEQGARGAASSAVGLDVLVSDLVRELSPAAVEHEVSLCTEVPARIFVDVHENAFRGVLENLVRNAFRSTPPGGTISLVAEERNGEVLVAVRNTGELPASGPQHRLFEKLSRLVLYFCRRSVEANGGRIARVARPGWAASVEVTLPLET